MNIMRNNVVYIVLALLAIVLIGITVGLQIVILSNPGSSQAPTSGTPNALDITGDSTQGNAVVLASMPTNTPVLIVVQSTLPSSTPTQSPQNVESTTTTPSAPGEGAIAAQPAPDAVDSLRTMMNTANVTSSQDDDVRMTVLTSDPFAISFFGYAYYIQHNEFVRSIKIQLDGGRIVEPGRESVLSGTYPLARPLYIYSTATDIQQKPQIEAFLGCYLNRINTEIMQTGYFPTEQFLFTASINNFDENCALCKKDGVLPACTLDNIPNDPIDISGSSTVFPITQHMVDLFTSIGFAGDIQVAPIGTGTGFIRFCEEGLSDIVNADRSIKESELATCRSINREPIAFPIGTDAITLVVSKENTFVNNLTLAELQAVFATAKTWSDVRPDWPDELVKRIIPSEQSGSLDFFANLVYTDSGAQVFESAANAIMLTTQVDTPTALPQEAIAQAAPAEEADIAPEAPAAEAPTQTPPPQIPSSLPLVEPTSTPGPPTPIPTPTDPLLPGFAHSEDEEEENTPPFDFVLAWVPDRPECLMTTQIVQKVIHQNYGLRFFAERHNDLDEMYADFKNLDGEALQHVSLCYADPLDRKYLLELSSWMSFIGNGYWKSGSQRWFVAAHSHVLNDLPARDPCLEQFFKQLDFGEGPLDPPDVDAWIAAHPDRVEAWLQCE